MKSQYSYLRARRFMRDSQLGLCFATVLAGTSAVASPVSFTYTGSIQTFTIPTTGMYLLSAAGAAGGGESAGSGGLGAVGSGSVFLNAGTELDIVVGGEGGSILNAELNGLAFPPAGAGGGGTFLFVVGASDPLLVAGGGGGWARDSTTGGQAGTAGASGEGGGGAGGTGGQGGAGAADSSGAGAGWLSNGGGVTSGLCLLSGPAQGGQSGPTFAGGIGASDGTGCLNGGFGGGGGGGNIGAAGGGGYSGGGAGGPSSTSGGGGGGSYANIALTGVTITGASNYGDGSASIDLISVSAPEPSSVGAFGAGLLFLGVMRKGSRFR